MSARGNWRKDLVSKVSASKTPGELLDAVSVDDFALIISDEAIYRGVMLHATILMLMKASGRYGVDENTS